MNRPVSAVVRWTVAPVVGVIGYLLAPPVDNKHPPTDLSAFFTTCATLLGTFFIALALLSIASPLADLRIRRIVGKITFVYLALGAIAAAGGTGVTWIYSLYTYFFAVTVGTGIAIMLAITMVGIENLRTQRDEIHANRARFLGGSPETDSSGGLADQLAKLADLHDRGIVTNDEFERAKAKILV